MSSNSYMNEKKVKAPEPKTAEKKLLFLKRDEPKWKKYSLYFIYFCIAYLIVFRPERVGTIIGTWVHDLFGSMWKAMQF